MDDTPGILVNFVFAYCHDVDAMRSFYTDLLGLSEMSYCNDDEWQCLIYKCGSLELEFFADPNYTPPSGWARQPGWSGGTSPVTSWSATVPLEQYHSVVTRLKAAGVECFAADPVWRYNSYWSFPVKDPAGNTVELCGIPQQRPEAPEWPGSLGT